MLLDVFFFFFALFFCVAGCIFIFLCLVLVFRHGNCKPFCVNAPNLWHQLTELLVPVRRTHREGLKLFYSQTVDISLIWRILEKHKAKWKFWRPFAKWNACLIHASAPCYARLWNMAPGRTLFNAGTVFQTTGVILGQGPDRDWGQESRFISCNAISFTLVLITKGVKLPWAVVFGHCPVTALCRQRNRSKCDTTVHLNAESLWPWQCFVGHCPVVCWTLSSDCPP